ncbi:arsenate reductase ArsC [Pseudaquidulcibacter saccharophilus]|uniref:arsenate reductase ArsC n=1 Tax=Pseudaquidulcibacter saccharophilus TaxID=2831900 RepID=UPI0023D93F23|nr:arsenate reductase ArsC [Pseudaquidulcibacter saccharophilus]
MEPSFLRPPQAILFACTMNSIRSPMAEALFKLRFGTRAYCDSCGLRKGTIDPMAVFAMDDLGVDLSKHRAKTFDMLDDDNFDLIITLSPEAHHRALEFTRHLSLEVEFWNTFDPSLAEGTREQRMDAFIEVRNQLDRKIRDRFAELKP